MYAIAATLILTIGIEFSVFLFMQSVQQPTQFTDFPTAQAIFKARKTSTKPSWKERYLKKYNRFQKNRSVEYNRKFRNNI